MAKLLSKQKRKRLGQPRPAPTGGNQTPGLAQPGSSPAGRGNANAAPLGTDLRKQQQRRDIATKSATATLGQEVGAFTKTPLAPELSRKLQRKIGTLLDTDVATQRSLDFKQKFGDRSILFDRIAGRKPFLQHTRRELDAQDKLLRSVGIDPTTMGALGAAGLPPSPGAPAAPIRTPSQIAEEIATTPLPKGSTFEAVTGPSGRKIFKLRGPDAARDVQGLITDIAGTRIGRTAFTIEEDRYGQRKVFTGRVFSQSLVDDRFKAAKADELARGVDPDETIDATRTRLGIPVGFLRPTIQLKGPENLLEQAGDDPALIEIALKKIERAYVTNADQPRDLTTQKAYVAAKEHIWGIAQDLRGVRLGAASLQTAVNALGGAKGNEFHSLFEGLMADPDGRDLIRANPNWRVWANRFRVETARLIKVAREAEDKKEVSRLRKLEAMAKKDAIRATILSEGALEDKGGYVTSIVRGGRITQQVRGNITDVMRDTLRWNTLTKEGTWVAAQEMIWLGGRHETDGRTRKGLDTLIKQVITNMNLKSIPQSEQAELLGRYLHNPNWTADLRIVVRSHLPSKGKGIEPLVSKALDSPPSIGMEGKPPEQQIPGVGGLAPSTTGAAPMADGQVEPEPVVEAEPPIPGTPPPVAPPEPTETGEPGELEEPTVTEPTVLAPAKEDKFREWYVEIAQAGGLAREPDDLAFYDIRGMFDAGDGLDDNNQLPGEFRMAGWTDPGEPVPPPPVLEPGGSFVEWETEMRAYREQHGQTHQQQQVTRILRDLARQREASTGSRSTNTGRVPIEPRPASAGKRAFLGSLLSGR